MAGKYLSLLVIASLMTLGLSDFYMSNPRGSNNRLNEQAANRDNGDRLFDSQNNNRGGYNVGDKTNNAFNGNNPTGGATVDTMASKADTTTMQYSMVYFEGSILPVEWTNQHGCGGNQQGDPNKLNCNMVLQYTCDTIDATAYGGDYAMNVHLADGGNTNAPDQPNSITDVSSGSTRTSNDNNNRGRHESEGWYFECETRSRNKRLFTADQNLNGNQAIYTRQNPNGNRRGLECPEERDYYPYWTPTPWRDIAYLTDRLDLCPWVVGESINKGYKYKCKESGFPTTNPYSQTSVIAALTQQDCSNAAGGGQWVGFTHGMPASYPDMDCKQMDWTRDNHLGNGRYGQPLTYNWTLPLFADLTSSGKVPSTSASGASVATIKTYGAANNYVKCVFRMRYNMSTDDYDPWNTTSTSNQNQGQGVQSPVTQNPTVDVGAYDLQGLQLAINTNQFGRTFQDRSHVFYIKKRPASGNSATDQKRIMNLNVRGKRCNIVQCYPAVEYDFIPNIVTVKIGTPVLTTDYGLLHIQWTGSNTHNNGDPAGDGQAGDAGEGTEGTDRHSWCQTATSADTYPLPLDKYPEALILGPNSQCWDGYDFQNYASKYPSSTAGLSCALQLATSAQYLVPTDAQTTFNPTLDNAPASLPSGILLEPLTTGVFNYIDTRNNNFSNRSTKGAITVVA